MSLRIDNPNSPVALQRHLLHCLFTWYAGGEITRTIICSRHFFSLAKCDEEKICKNTYEFVLFVVRIAFPDATLLNLAQVMLNS
jgi:hypothetical protein